MIEIEVIVSYEGKVMIGIPIAKRVAHTRLVWDVPTDRLVEANSTIKHNIFTERLIMIMRIVIVVL
jgi:hypothetical protein